MQISRHPTDTSESGTIGHILSFEMEVSYYTKSPEALCTELRQLENPREQFRSRPERKHCTAVALESHFIYHIKNALPMRVPVQMG